MGIFTRFRDIVSANINAMLDKAEDPEKLIKLMIREMEDTLVEIKASCAGVMANGKKVQRQLDEAQSREEYWGQRAELAVNKGRDDLAREALMEKQRYSASEDALKRELTECDGLIEQYQDDIRQLEDKLGTAREKQRVLVQRHIHANRKRRAQQEIRRMDIAETVIKFCEKLVQFFAHTFNLFDIHIDSPYKRYVHKKLSTSTAQFLEPNLRCSANLHFSQRH